MATDSLFWNLGTYLSVSMMIYCNPAISPVDLILSKLHNIFKMLQYYIQSVYFDRIFEKLNECKNVKIRINKKRKKKKTNSNSNQSKKTTHIVGL